MRKTGRIVSKIIVLSAQMEGKLRLKNTKTKRTRLVMNKASKSMNVKTVVIAL
jgi:hypothetical protein